MLEINEVYHGDCEELIQSINYESIDCIITDPPYGINIAQWDTIFDIVTISKEWCRVLKPNGSLFVFCAWSNEPMVRSLMNDNLLLKDCIIYDRIKGRGGKKSLTSTREDILWYVKGKEYTFNKPLAYSTIKKKTGGLGLKNGQPNRSLSNVWTDISPIVPWSKERVKHPTQKPVKLIERILNVFTNKDDLILDCFAGSGTTGVACKNTQRRFILIEKELEYCTLAEKRIIDVG